MKTNSCQVILTCLLLTIPAVSYAGEDIGGLNWQNLSDSITIVTIKNELELKAQRREALKQLIEKQIQEAKEKSAQVLSKEELAKIKEQADRVIREAKEEIAQLERELKEGALVICSSQNI
jgi:acyl-CoA reductase-like NAD-dependent aldehyde dehydrogenase